MAQIYRVDLNGPGRGYHEAAQEVTSMTHLPITGGYLVVGDAARVTLLSHNHEGDVIVTARPATEFDVPDEEGTEAATHDIVVFVEVVAGAPFTFDESTSTWRLGSQSPTPAADRRSAALAALAQVVRG